MRNVRTRTTMSHAFEAALQPYLTVASNAASELTSVVVQKMTVGFREEPGWTARTSVSTQKTPKRRQKRTAR
jgi:hypothetical protein